MNPDSSHNVDHVWGEVRHWLPKQRLALATRILQSLQQEEKVVSPERQESLHRLIGIWKTDQPPGDSEVEQIIKEERMKKYG
jgi:hypothetical protein